MPAEDTLTIEHEAADGAKTVLKDGLKVLEGEIVDAAVMRRKALDAFLAEQIEDARAKGVLFSVHLKATMMKVSDPIIFGHVVRTFFEGVFAEHGDALARAGANPNNGLASVKTALEKLDACRARGDRGRDRGDLRDRAEARDGRLRPRHHEPARPQRRDHRRVDAGDDPHERADVERRRRAAGRQGGHPRLQLRGAVRRDDRPLPRARRVRPVDDGHDAERRPDGAEGRGVRQPRQDVRDRGGGHRARAVLGRRRAARARGRGRRPVARLPDQGRAGRRLGPAGDRARPRERRAGRVLARRVARARRAGAREGQALPARARRRRRADRGPARRARRPASRSGARARARTRSPPPATCCATT